MPVAWAGPPKVRPVWVGVLTRVGPGLWPVWDRVSGPCGTGSLTRWDRVSGPVGPGLWPGWDRVSGPCGTGSLARVGPGLWPGRDLCGNLSLTRSIKIAAGSLAGLHKQALYHDTLDVSMRRAQSCAMTQSSCARITRTRTAESTVEMSWSGCGFVFFSLSSSMPRKVSLLQASDLT